MTREQERNLELAVLALLLLWSDRLEASLRVTLATLITDVIESIRKAGTLPPDVGDVMNVPEWKSKLNRSYEYHWKGAVVGGLALMAGFIWKAMGKSSKSPKSINDLNAFLKADFARWIEQRLGSAWIHLTSSVRQKLNRIIGKMVNAETPFSDAIDDFEREARHWAEVGARNAAGTEMNAATNKGYELARRSAELQGKMWRNPLDSRTRRPNKKTGKGKYDHWKPNGQVRRENDPFLVSGESLMFPGDMSLGATIGNIANCFHPDTQIHGQVVGAMRCQFNGFMIELILENGYSLRVTPGHPIKTESGEFVAAGKLSMTSRVLAAKKATMRPCEFFNGGVFAIGPSSVCDVFRVLAEQGKPKTQLPDDDWHHGDGKYMAWSERVDTAGYVASAEKSDSQIEDLIPSASFAIAELRRFRYCGLVYDVQTLSGELVADGIVCHNCRCWTVPYFGPYP